MTDNIFDKSTTKMILNIIADGLEKENQFFANMMRTYIEDGEFKSAAEMVVNVVDEIYKYKWY